MLSRDGEQDTKLFKRGLRTKTKIQLTTCDICKYLINLFLPSQAIEFIQYTSVHMSHLTVDILIDVINIIETLKEFLTAQKLQTDPVSSVTEQCKNAISTT